MFKLRSKAEEDAGIYLTSPLRPLWGGLFMFGLFATFAVTAVTGVDLDSSAVRTLGFGFAIFLGGIFFLLATEDSITVRDWQGRQIALREERFRRRSRIWLDELASVGREQSDGGQTLRLTDVRGKTLLIPLGRWPGERRLLHEIADAAVAAGASGEVGDAIHVADPIWTRVAWPFLLYGGLVGYISVLVVLEVLK
jgi:hypothetical protein